MNIKLSPIMQKLVEAQRPDGFDANMQVKAHLASSYLGDANDFLWRVEACSQHQESEVPSFRAKVCIDLLMAIECDLKSVIFSLSEANEECESAYKSARYGGHKIKSLLEEVERRVAAKNPGQSGESQLTLPALPGKLHDQLVAIPMDYRYWLDVSLDDFFGMRNCKGLARCGELIDDLFIDWSWFDEAKSFAFGVHQYSNAIYDKFLKQHAMHMGDETQARDDRFRKFFSETKK